MGKLPSKELKNLLSYIKKDQRVLVPPMVGYDSGVHLIDDDRYLVISTDHCIGVPDGWFGWFLIHYVASDIALFGARAEFCTINLLGSPLTKPSAFKRVMKQACNVAEDLNIAIVTGHTGSYEGLTTLMGVCTAYGFVEKSKLITPGDAKPDDEIFCVKPIGLEIAINFALSHKSTAERIFGVYKTRKLAKLVNVQTCVKSASLMARMHGVNAMHDATEGGIIAALNEIAEASNVGFTIELDKIPIPEEVKQLQNYFNLSQRQVLSMSSTGTILAAVNSKAKEKVVEMLTRNNISVKLLGAFTESKHRVLIQNGESHKFPEKADDPYEQIMTGHHEH
jgi:hydrogenase expression/formation protein HypE